jgi:MinD-like ATPase involved in chromosome partitioning or flagellar assembly
VTSERYVVVGLAHVRSGWFTEVARWSTSGSVPVEFVKCVSLEELRARVRSGRPFSAALLDGRLPSVDRDLIASLRDLGVPSLVVRAPGTATDWIQLGAAAVLTPELPRHDLIDALVEHARQIAPATRDLIDLTEHSLPSAWLGRVVAVTGRSGAGASTIAAALSQALSDDPRNGNDVVLADLARHAHQALLHDARDVVPGIQELVEAHRNGRPTAEQVRRLTYVVPTRGYRLVLGLRRSSDWVTIRSRAFSAALEGLRSACRLVVADVDADLEGEAATGSADIEDRNLMALTVTAMADVVVVVAQPTTTGLHGLAVQIDELRSHGVPGGRILVVLNRAPRGARARAELTRAVAELTGAGEVDDPHAGPVFVPERRSVDHVHRDLVRFPSSIATPPKVGVTAVLDRHGPRLTSDHGPELIAPGSIGHWGAEPGEEESS